MIANCLDFEDEVETDYEMQAYHFTYIKNLSGLINHQIGNIKHKKIYCERCLNHFTQPDALEKHMDDCKVLNDAKMVLPKDHEATITFKNFRNKLKVPFVIYADLESILVTHEEPNNENVKTEKYKKHVAYNKVRDHCHLTGMFRGATHFSCNLNYKDSQHVPVIFHNLSGYDSHFIIKTLAKEIKGNISLLPLNKEKYISFSKAIPNTIITFRFLDSFRFMSSSLDKLSSYLNDNQKKITKIFYNNDEKFNLVTRKGVFPYERHPCLPFSFSLDSLHYYTAPGLAFDALLKITEVKLELLQDIDMILFFEKANNKYIGEKFNSEEPSSYLLYLDINNLYGAATCQALPIGEFQWINNVDIYNEKFLSIPDNNEYGYVLEVDLHYPKELFELHKDLPLCPQHIIPPISTSNIPKLLTTLYDKSKYVIHYKNLQQAVKLGLQIKKIHRCLKFRQSSCLKEYIDLNTEMRKKSENDFQKNFYKLMNLAPFGKIIENTFLRYLYDFHYNYIKNKFGNNAKLLYCDTDSLIYHFYVDDIYEHIKTDIHKFDTSDYAVDNIYNIPRVNKKELGLMKDENSGKIMLEFIGLRSKMYCYKLQMNEDEEKKQIQKLIDNRFSNEYIKNFIQNFGVTKKAKGIQSSALKLISFDDYFNCLFDNHEIDVTQNLIL
ncbi:hypothetical protein NQ315_012508 [Exocentrus adspersus]|uniref:DNA-directed DNA polymerase n=1 Tax=Exocentrus adspersus TaxID=1586481 RepID=A0AAV8V9G8_9CUCU|nr:hypothetical protein NQ315_012508 [Exocentrus adspersus]